MSSHNLCFEQKQEKCHNFYLKNAVHRVMKVRTKVQKYVIV